MCDTHVFRRDGVTYFAKNSDREPGEAQLITRIPPVLDDRAPKVRTTYLEVPQCSRRHGVILSKPFWIWGAEIGVNDQGVAIGNEAVFTRVHEKSTGLIGMDLLRLGLERGSSAREALEVITEHLEKYGQGGACGYRYRNFSYDNSFLITDAREAWILETACRHWVAKKVGALGAISNRLELGDDFDLKSKGVEDFARKRGLCRGEFHFARAFGDLLFTFTSGSRHRLNASIRSLNDICGRPAVDLHSFMENLRMHRRTAGYRAGGSYDNGDICMHAAGYIRRSQTCGAMVCRLTDKANAHFVTGTSATCLSIFKPVDFDGENSRLFSDGHTVGGSLWERHEHIHRRVILDGHRLPELQESRDRAEKAMLAVFSDPFRQVGREQMQSAGEAAMAWEEEWHAYFCRRPFAYSRFKLHHRYWRRRNSEDGF